MSSWVASVSSRAIFSGIRGTQRLITFDSSARGSMTRALSQTLCMLPERADVTHYEPESRTVPVFTQRLPTRYHICEQSKNARQWPAQLSVKSGFCNTLSSNSSGYLKCSAMPCSCAYCTTTVSILLIQYTL